MMKVRTPYKPKTVVPVDTVAKPDVFMSSSYIPVAMSISIVVPTKDQIIRKFLGAVKVKLFHDMLRRKYAEKHGE